MLEAVELRPVERRSLRLAGGHELWVADDGSPLAPALVERLERDGLTVRLIGPRAGWRNVERRNIAGLILLEPLTDEDDPLAEKAEAALKSAFRRVQRLAGNLRRAADAGGALLATVSRLDGHFGLTGEITSAIAGGYGGLVKTVAHEWPQVRCRALDVARDWADAEAVAEAIAAELGSDGPLEVGLSPRAPLPLAEESRDGRASSSARRIGLALVERPAGGEVLPLEAGDVVVVTGGARGVTAACALAMAEALPLTLVLLGRSPEPQPEPDWLASLTDEAAIKRALLSRAFAGKRPKPIELEAEYRRRMAAREIARNLAALRAAGATVVYRAADIRDARVVRAVLADVRRSHGPIRGLVHGAGVLADHRIEDKTAEQFDAVFDTKVAGLRNLLAATGEDELRVLALFSSVSGRFGRQGQADYAMANEVLNKLAQREARRRAGCRVVAINWGPWEGGMVTPSLAREFERLGIGLIPLRAGALALLDELRAPPGGEVEVVIGNGFEQQDGGIKRAGNKNANVENAETEESSGGAGDATGAGGARTPLPSREGLGEGRVPKGRCPVAGTESGSSVGFDPPVVPPERGDGGRQPPRTDGGPPSAGQTILLGGRPPSAGPTVVFERVLSLATHPVLASHVIDGRPVLPLAITLEWLASAALERASRSHLLAVEDLRVFKGVILQDESWPVRVAVGPPQAAGDDALAMTAELRGGAGGSVLHARGRVVAGTRPAADAPAAGAVKDTVPAGRSAALDATRIYADLLFHGPDFHAIERVAGLSPEGMTALVRAAPQPAAWMDRPVRETWLTDPLLIDAGLQMGIVWCREHVGSPALPSRIGRYEQFCERFAPGRHRLSLAVRAHDANRLLADVELRPAGEAAGPPVARLRDCEWTVSPALAAAFRKCTLDDAAAARSAADG